MQFFIATMCAVLYSWKRNNMIYYNIWILPNTSVLNKEMPSTKLSFNNSRHLQSTYILRKNDVILQFLLNVYSFDELIGHVYDNQLYHLAIISIRYYSILYVA